MARWLVTCLIGLLLAAPAAAQAPAAHGIMREVCAHVPSPPHLRTEREALTPGQTYRNLYTFMADRQGSPTIRVDGVEGTARWQRPSFELTIRRSGSTRDPDGAPAAQAWNQVFFTVFVRPLRPSARASGDMAADGAVLATTLPWRQGAQADSFIVPLEFEPRAQFWRQAWEILVLPCLRASDDSPETFAIGYGRAEAVLVSPLFGALAGLSVAVVALLVLGFAASRINGHQLEPGDRGEGAMWRFSPAFICQDAFGYMSLARFQVFLFTLALLGVYAYVFVMTGKIPEVHPSVLVLAGITLGGSTLATATTKPLVDTGNRLWLVGNGLLDQPRRRPRWTDLLTGDGEVDITRVQALAFTCFAVASLIISGAENLSGFAIPEQLNYLIGLSQTVYVAGKALPADAPRRLNEELRSLRAAERLVIEKPDDVAAAADFRRQCTGVASSLTDLFGERFFRHRLDELQARLLAGASAAAAFAPPAEAPAIPPGASAAPG
ncbi:MAG: hypothetical protein MUC64_12220 [Rubritepida sp.]|jgi:hypothetical protein|nr:hypothetical protein [Rubritepida sp.]